MYTDRNAVNPYPYQGYFWDVQEQTTNPDLLNSDPQPVIILETRCDIQESANRYYRNGVVSDYNIFFPFTEDINVVIGNKFTATVHGVSIEGVVVGIFPTELEGCKAAIKK